MRLPILLLLLASLLTADARQPPSLRHLLQQHPSSTTAAIRTSSTTPNSSSSDDHAGFLLNDLDSSNQADRAEGSGSFGRVFKQLLQRINANAAAVPRAGSVATSDSIALGDAAAAAQRKSVAGFERSPLRTGSLGRAGAAAVDPSAAAAAVANSASAVAKGIVRDDNSTVRDLGAAGISEGITISEDVARYNSTDASEFWWRQGQLAVQKQCRTSSAACLFLALLHSYPQRPKTHHRSLSPGAQVLGGSASTAGEKAIQTAFALPFGQSLVILSNGARDDGGNDQSRLVANGIGAAGAGGQWTRGAPGG